MNDQEIQKYIKKVRDDANEDMKLHLGALNEMHGETLKTINENFVLVNNKLDKHTKILDSHTEMIGEMKEDIQVLKEDMKEVKEVKEVKEDLKNKTDYSEFLVLKNQVSLRK